MSKYERKYDRHIINVSLWTFCWHTKTRTPFIEASIGRARSGAWWFVIGRFEVYKHPKPPTTRKQSVES